MKFLLVLLVCLSQCVSAFSQSPAKNTDTFLNSKLFISWAKEHALRIQNSDSAIGDNDLQPLKKMIGEAQVVALGEPAHGFHEPLAFRNRMFRFLAEHCGFTAVILEAGLAESRLAADFVTGGPGTAREAAAKLTIGNPASENIELLEWMRKYNANPANKHKLKFNGMDMQLRGFPGDTTPSHAALSEVLAYLNHVDTKEAAKLISAFAPYLNRLSVAKYPQLSTAEHNTFSTMLDDLIALFICERINFIGSSSKDSYEWALHNALVAQQTDRMVRVTPPEQPGKISPDAWRSANVRDASMADNVMWILKYGAAGGKVFVFAHNAHVKNDVTVGGFWDAFAQPPHGMGQFLRSILGNRLFIMGSSCAPSPGTAQPGSLDKALLQVAEPRFILDLRSASRNPSIASWLLMRRPMEANTVSHFMLKVSDAFDALLFINKRNKN